MKNLVSISLVAFLTGCFILFAQISIAADAEEEQTAPSFTVSRLLIAGSIEDLEPVGMVNAFSRTTEKVYCFLDAKGITEDTTVSFVWYHNEQQLAKVDLPLRKGKRWRTYSSKKLGGLKGEWKVDLQDEYGNVIDTAMFTVE